MTYDLKLLSVAVVAAILAGPAWSQAPGTDAVSPDRPDREKPSSSVRCFDETALQWKAGTDCGAVLVPEATVDGDPADAAPALDVANSPGPLPPIGHEAPMGPLPPIGYEAPVEASPRGIWSEANPAS